MKYLFVHEVSYLHKPVNEFQDFPERLAKAGHEVIVVDFVEFEKTGILDRYVSRTGLADIRLISIPHSNVPVLKYFQAQINYLFILYRLVKFEKINAIFLYSVFISGVTTVLFSKLTNTPVHYRVLDVYHKLRPGFFTQLILKLGEGFIYRNAKSIVPTNDRLKEYVMTYLDLNNKSDLLRLSVLTHGVDVDHFSQTPDVIELIATLDIHPDDFVIMFLGTTYNFSRLEKFIELLVPYLQRSKNWKFLILGAGELDAKINNVISDNNLTSQVHAVGMIDYMSLPQYMSISTVGVNTFEINEITRDIVPIKNLQYLAAAMPVISTPLKDLVSLLPADEMAVLYAKTDNLSELLLLVDSVSKRIDIDKMKNHAKELAIKNHSISQTITDLAALMNSGIR
jgi:glycosyltransferase involved in cell wall biosynthesis